MSLLSDITFPGISDENMTGNLKILQIMMQKLLSGELKSGQAIKESQLAKEFSLSRNAVREGLSQLVGNGLLEYRPYCGYSIKSFGPHDLLDWSEARAAFEPVAARRLARQRPPQVIRKLRECLDCYLKAAEEKDHQTMIEADLAFHANVVLNCGNRIFSGVQIAYSMFIYFAIGADCFPDLRYKVSETVAEVGEEACNRDEFAKICQDESIKAHRRMFDAIKSGDAETAEYEFRIHAYSQVESIEKIIAYYAEMSIEDFVKLEQIQFS